MLRLRVLTVIIAAMMLVSAPLLEASSLYSPRLSASESDHAKMALLELDNEELDARAAELRQKLGADPADEKLYRLLATCVSIIAARQVEAELIALRKAGESIDYDGIQARYLEEMTTAVGPVLDQWQKQLPDSCGPLLIRVEMAPDAEARKTLLIEGMERCPNDAAVVASYAGLLGFEGDFTQGRQLLEDFVASHPDDPEPFIALVSLMGFFGEQTETLEIIATWRERQPDNVAAQQAELWYRRNQLSLQELEAVAGQLLQREQEGDELLSTCRLLADLDLQQQTEECFRRVLRQYGDDDRSLAPGAFVGLLRSLGSQRAWDAVEELAVNVPEAVDSRQAHIRVAQTLVEADRCAAAVGLVRDLDPDKPPNRIDLSAWKTAIASVQTRCGDESTGKASMLNVVRNTNLQELRRVLFRAEIEFEQLESILLQRLQEGEDPAQLYAILASAASSADPPEKRLSYLEAWAQEAPDDPAPTRQLARALRRADAIDLAIEAQRETVRRAGEDDGQGTYAIADLIEMLIEVKRFDEAAALANEIAAQDGEAPRGQLLLAEIAVAEGRTEDAIPLYEAFLAEDPAACYQILDYLKILRDEGRMRGQSHIGVAQPSCATYLTRAATHTAHRPCSIC